MQKQAELHYMHLLNPPSPRKTRRSRRGGRPTRASGRTDSIFLRDKLCTIKQAVCADLVSLPAPAPFPSPWQRALCPALCPRFRTPVAGRYRTLSPASRAVCQGDTPWTPSAAEAGNIPTEPPFAAIRPTGKNPFRICTRSLRAPELPAGGLSPQAEPPGQRPGGVFFVFT